jgi:hypothetical protein
VFSHDPFTGYVPASGDTGLEFSVKPTNPGSISGAWTWFYVNFIRVSSITGSGSTGSLQITLTPTYTGETVNVAAFMFYISRVPELIDHATLCFFPQATANGTIGRHPHADALCNLWRTAPDDEKPGWARKVVEALLRARWDLNSIKRYLVNAGIPGDYALIGEVQEGDAAALLPRAPPPSPSEADWQSVPGSRPPIVPLAAVPRAAAVHLSSSSLSSHFSSLSSSSSSSSHIAVPERRCAAHGMTLAAVKAAANRLFQGHAPSVVDNSASETRPVAASSTSAVSQPLLARLV